jgi:hypothetical protein
MPTDPTTPPDPADPWRGDFHSAEERQLERWATATPSQRLQWLEEAIAFAYRMGALPRKPEE